MEKRRLFKLLNDSRVELRKAKLLDDQENKIIEERIYIHCYENIKKEMFGGSRKN